MDPKKLNAQISTITRDNNQLDQSTGNIYETISILSKRANQLEVKFKEELDDKLLEFSSNMDNLEEIFENREQIEISKHYEKLPKSAAIAIEEYLNGKIYYRRPEVVEVPKI